MKRLSIVVDDDFHREIKSKTAKEGKSITEYITEVLKKDIGECEDVRESK